VRGKKTLGREDLRLWGRAMANTKPLPGRTAPSIEATEPPVAEPTSRGLRVPSYPGIEGTVKQRLRRGTIRIEERIDLHGLRQDAAHAALNAFLSGAQSRGARLVLVITGKGRGSDSTLRRLVPLWLLDGMNRLRVAMVSQAEARHGGAGALYVYLTRRAGS
jgi:DNA-nicking Smr family endonuclease